LGAELSTGLLLVPLPLAEAAGSSHSHFLGGSTSIRPLKLLVIGERDKKERKKKKKTKKRKKPGVER
jgi:hypothetical protein